MKIRKILQIIFLFIFIYLVISLKYEYAKSYLPNIFFRADPLLLLLALVNKGAVSLFLPAGVVLFFTLLYGRFFCGWICPLGNLFDIIGYLKKKTKNVQYIRFYNFKLYLLILLLILMFFGQQFIWLFDPMSILSQGVVFTLRKNIPYLLIFVILVTIILYHRVWCQVLCPTGAIFSLFSRVRIIRRSADENCNECKKCYILCPMGAISLSGKNSISAECISCFNCVSVCPRRAVKFDTIF